jgi:Ca2+-binding EF-hand superfamily protein
MKKCLIATVMVTVLAGCGVTPGAGTSVSGVIQGSAARKNANSLEAAVKSLFVAVDANKDGTLTFQEFLQSSEKDNNVGGIGTMLSAYSWLALGALSEQRDFKDAKDLGAAFRAAKEQRVTWASLSASLTSEFFESRALAMATAFVQKNDKNGDKRLEVSEVGDDAKGLDRNRDGVLSLTEISEGLLRYTITSEGAPGSRLGMFGLSLAALKS